MSDWTAIVIARPEEEGGPMASRLPSFIHPVAGRPLVWHTVNSLTVPRDGPSEVVVFAPPQYPFEFLDNVGLPVRVVPIGESGDVDVDGLAARGDGVIVIHASACIDPLGFQRLLRSEPGAWLPGSDNVAAAFVATPRDLPPILSQEAPFAVSSGRLDPLRKLVDASGTFIVRTREDLARAHQRVRDGLVRTLMQGGVTFLAPESVIVDVDVRIGRDTVIYPAVVLEGQTNIGEETVIGPGCRIIDSWIGSGVELKGWNYIAHTSVRNRAILEPYVRRGFS